MLDASALSFVPNVGQTNGAARFVALGRDFTTFLAEHGPVFALHGKGGRTTDALRMTFEHARTDVQPTVERELPGKFNYLRGNDPQKWKRDVPTFAAVRYAKVYDGVDAVFYGSGDRLEYDFVVAPGADASNIAVRFEGQRSLSVDEDGALRVELSGGELRQLRPVAYQEGAAKQHVSARYAIGADGAVRVDVGEFDRSRPLVVDPVLEFTAYVSGTDLWGTEEGYAVATDGDGATYFTGRASGPDFPTTPGAYDTTVSMNFDAFVTKIDPTGSTIEFSTFLGGEGSSELPYDLAVDAAGSVYVAGSVGRIGNAVVDFPVTAGAYQTTYGGGFYDAFVSKLDATGSSLLYSTMLGQGGSDILAALAVDGTGRAVVTGHIDQAPYVFPTTSGAFDTTANGRQDSFVSELSADGAALVFSTLLGGQIDDLAEDVAVDASGLYVVGSTSSDDFPTSPGAYTTTPQGNGEAFVTKLAPGGSALVYSTRLGGESFDGGFGLALGPDGSCYVTGYTSSTTFPTTPGAFDRTSNGYDAFVTKLNPAGSALVFSTYLGGSAEEGGGKIAVDRSGFVYAVGGTESADFPATSDAFDTTYGSGNDGFVAIFSADGTGLVYASYVGGSGSDGIGSMALDPDGNVHLGGTTTSSDFAQTGFGFDDSTRPFVLVLRGVTGDSPGIYVPASGAWFLENAAAAGGADSVFTYGGGGSGLVALRGDWDGDGVDTPGLYDPASGAFFLRNESTPGPADLLFTFGAGGPDVVPVTGDFDGDGTDSVGIYVRSTGSFFLKNANAPGPADSVFTFGAGGAGVVPIFGDWDGDGDDTPALYVVATGTFFVRNANDSGGADAAFTFGAGGATPLAGDWNGDGVDTVGLYFPLNGAWFLRNTNSAGPADLAFAYGPPNVVPVVGNWDGQ